MLHPVKNDDGPSFRVLLFYFFLLSTFSGAQTSDLICSHQPIVAVAGDDVILPCRLNSSVSVSTVEWSRPDLDPKYIHVYKDGRSMPQSQNPSYRLRTRLFTSELKNGNVSLKILRVKMSDKGKYQCVLPSNKEAFIELNVGAVSTPTIELLSNDSLSPVLSCKSKGWYPEPEVLWLDGEGNLLSAEPTETIRGPDDLYTVSSTVTVEKRHSNRFTCRVQQKSINQTRETHFDVSDDPDKPPDTLMSVNTIPHAVLLPVVLLVLLVVAVFIVRTLRRTSVVLSSVGADNNDYTFTRLDTLESAILKRLRIFLIGSIVILLLLLLLLVFFVAVSVNERLEYTDVPFSPLEIFLSVGVILLLLLLLLLVIFSAWTFEYDCSFCCCIVSIILVPILLLVFLVVAVFIFIKWRFAYYTFSPLEIFLIVSVVLLLVLLVVAFFSICTFIDYLFKHWRIFLTVSIIVFLLFLLIFICFIAVSVNERLKYTAVPLNPLEIFLIVGVILLLLFLAAFVFFFKKLYDADYSDKELRFLPIVSIIVLLLLLLLLVFFITVSVNERLKYTNDPLSPLEISVIVVIIILPIVLVPLLAVAVFFTKKLDDIRTEMDRLYGISLPVL